MSKFYCNVCNEEVSLQNGKCPKCKTNWDKITEEKLDNATPIEFKEEYEEIDKTDVKNITELDINNNISFFLRWAFRGKVFMIILAIISIIVALATVEDTDGASLFLLIFAVVVISYAKIFENNLKWKAYMLHTNSKKRK